MIYAYERSLEIRKFYLWPLKSIPRYSETSKLSTRKPQIKLLLPFGKIQLFKTVLLSHEMNFTRD